MRHKKSSGLAAAVFPMACLLLGTTACSDFLEIAPQSIYAEENLFQTTDHAEMEIYGIYSTLAGSALYGRNMTMYYDLDTDLAQIKGGTSTGAPDGERRSIARYAFTSDTKQINNAWNACYQGIERANIAIVKIPEMGLYKNGTEEEQKILKRCHGEALTLRAIFYFDLIRLFGDVPMKMTPSFTGENFDLTRTSRDVVYEKIIDDLRQAVDLVPWADEVTFDERITKGAVKGILARICLYAAGYSLRWDLESGNPSGIRMATIGDEARRRELYTIARDQCRDIILSSVHRLNPSFADLWKKLICGCKIDNEYRENIFEIGFYSLLHTVGEAGYYGNYNGPESKIAKAPKQGTSQGAMWVMPSFYLSYDPADARRDVSVCNLTFTGQAKGAPTALYNLTVGKWRNGWATETPTSLTDFNFPLLRYSDVLLMFAEADSWLNGAPTADAVDALKQVRKRAFPNRTADIEAENYPADLEGFMEVLIRERAFELAFEGFRKTDLIRWNKLTERIAWSKRETEILQNCYNKAGNKAYNGSIERLQGTVIPAVVVYKDNGGELVEVRETDVKPDDTWKTAEWLGSKFKTNMALFATGYEENHSEIFPVPKSIRDVTPAVSQVPGY